MSKRNQAAPEAGPKLQALTAQALQADKAASATKEKARLAKTKLKTIKSELKTAKAALKTAKKLARKAAKEAKRSHKALQASLDRVAKWKKRERRSAASRNADGPVRRTAVNTAKQPVSAEPSGNSG
jgi:chromosome segregation ATPase